MDAYLSPYIGVPFEIYFVRRYIMKQSIKQQVIIRIALIFICVIVSGIVTVSYTWVPSTPSVSHPLPQNSRLLLKSW